MEIVEILISVFKELIPSWWRRFKRWWKLHWFKFFKRKGPISDRESRQIAQAVLSGQIEEAKSFCNIDTKKSYIGVLRRENLDDFKVQFVLLEQLGETFIPKYEKELYKLPSKFEILDIDKDGMHEVTYILEDAGSGGGSKTLEIYSFKHDKVFSLSEYYNWSDATTSDAPQIKINKEIEPSFKEAFEMYAVEKGFLTRKFVDLNDPENAALNWHRMNGKKEEGEIKLHYYDGKPTYTSRPIKSEESNGIIWFGYFKGPLYGYIKNSHKHFIAYSPANIYNWPTSMIALSNKLLFGTHSKEGLYNFEYSKNKGVLKCKKRVG